MARTKQTARKPTGGLAPHRKPVPDTSLHFHKSPAPQSPHTAAQPGHLPSGSDLNWDLIEVSIDAEVLDLGTIWLPMINIKPNPAMACAWYQFDLEDLKKEFESETGTAIDTEQYDLTYGNENSTFAFNRTGGYRIALKRFVEAGDALDNILSLQIEAREGSQADSRNINTSRPKRARSRLTGTISDYSDDDSDQGNPPQKRRSTSLLQPSQQIPGEPLAMRLDHCIRPSARSSAGQMADDIDETVKSMRLKRMRLSVAVAKNELHNHKTKCADKKSQGMSTDWHKSRIPKCENELAKLEAQLREMERT